MFKGFRLALVVSVVCFGMVVALGQAAPCRAGTLADVLGTSCSVGPLTLNFQNTFAGIFSVNESGVPTHGGVPISPTEIGFTPIINENRVGFKLTTNFVDGPGADSGSFTGRLVNFSYTPQANPGFDIVGEIVQIDASAQSSATDSASETVADVQDYPLVSATNIFSTSPNPSISDQNGTIFSHLTDQIHLPSPALSSVGSFNDPQNITTFLQGQTTGTAQATLKSATFLYIVGPVGPLPPAPLTYSPLDLPGATGTLVSSITNSGRMAGAYQDAQGIFHGYITAGRSGFITVDFPNATATFGNGLNNRGDLVGSYTDATGNTHGFLLQEENFTTVDFPGAILTNPIAINDKRQIAGIYVTGDQGIHGFLFDDGQFISIDHNPDNFFPPFTEVLGINNRGEMVGTFLELVTLVGLVQRGDSFHIFNVPGQVGTVSQGVNEPGDQVGTYNDINSILHGFVGRDEVFRTVDFPNGQLTTPLGVNATGEIVGVYFDSAGNAHSFLAEPHTDNDGALNSAGINTDAAAQPGAAAPAALTRICGSTEWQQHPEHVRLGCKMAQSVQGNQ